MWSSWVKLVEEFKGGWVKSIRSKMPNEIKDVEEGEATRILVVVSVLVIIYSVNLLLDSKLYSGIIFEGKVCGASLEHAQTVE